MRALRPGAVVLHRVGGARLARRALAFGLIDTVSGETRGGVSRLLPGTGVSALCFGTPST